jgi:hypothetical protein
MVMVKLIFLNEEIALTLCGCARVAIHMSVCVCVHTYASRVCVHLHGFWTKLSVFKQCLHEESCRLGCYAMWHVWEPMFRRNVSLPSWGWQRIGEFRLLVTANVIPSSLILVTLMMEAIHSSGMSVLTRATQRNIPDDSILQSHCCENLKSYIIFTCSLYSRKSHKSSIFQTPIATNKRLHKHTEAATPSLKYRDWNNAQ